MTQSLSTALERATPRHDLILSLHAQRAHSLCVLHTNPCPTEYAELGEIDHLVQRTETRLTKIYKQHGIAALVNDESIHTTLAQLQNDIASLRSGVQSAVADAQINYFKSECQSVELYQAQHNDAARHAPLTLLHNTLKLLVNA